MYCTVVTYILVTTYIQGRYIYLQYVILEYKETELLYGIYHIIQPERERSLVFLFSFLIPAPHPLLVFFFGKGG